MCEEGGFFPWGRRWKLGLTLSVKGRHLSLSPHHLLEGSPVTPPPVHPSHPLSIHSPSSHCILLHIGPLCWITRNPQPLSLSFSLHPITNSPPLPLHFPPTLLPFASHPPTSRSPFSLSPINHPYITPVAKLLNYHTFVMSLVRTRDTVLIASPWPLIMRISVLVRYLERMKSTNFDIFPVDKAMICIQWW